VSDQPVQVNLGVAEDWSATGALTYLLPDAPAAAGRRQSRVTVQNKHYDPHAAPAGKSALTVFLESDHAFWQPLAADRAAYDAEKRRCAELVIEAIGRHRAGFADTVEVVDVSTPLTRERYTGNWLGAMQGWKPAADMLGALLSSKARYELATVKDFYMAGQWAEPWGGITTAAQSGRKVMKLISSREGRPFVTATP
jgi:phytoene dehydrogenase-like protein